MLLQSYSFSNDVSDIEFFYNIWDEIMRLKWYFYKFAGRYAEEAMQATFMHTLYHYDRSKGNLNVYIKSLARVISKQTSKEITVDFLEQAVDENGDTNLKDENNGTNTKVYLNHSKDFTDDIIFDIEKDDISRREIVSLSLEFMDKFIILCNALERHDTSTVYYPEVFIKSCMKISSKYDDFTKRCIDLYYEFAEYFDWFLNLDNQNQGNVWKETDHLFIKSNISKRIKFINKKTNKLVDDADIEEWTIKGKLNNKRIIKIQYADVWNMMCDLVDSDEINEIKFVIDDYYIIKTFGGSYSVLNPSLFNIYELIKTEILTNLLRDTGGRLINLGSEHIYIVCDEDFNNTNIERVVRGYNLKFDYEDITDSLS